MTLRLERRDDPGIGTGIVTLSDEGFRRIARIAEEEAGLSIPESKKALVQSRVAKRMRVIGLSDFAAYLSRVSEPSNQSERRELISILTTNVSSFFRERHHFDFLSKNLVSVFKTKLDSGRPVRIWSAGCSSGQEAYSIGITCLRAIPDAAEKDLLILATDIDPAILVRGKTATYTAAEVSVIPDEDRRRHFTTTDNGTTHSVRDPLRKLVRFRELNLHANWPMRMKFDAVFCRNVVIYFDEPHQQRLWPRFHAALVPGGFLFILSKSHLGHRP